MPLQDFALAVGIDLYPGLTTLGAAERDATDFFNWVTTAGGVKRADAALIVSSNYAPTPGVSTAMPAAQQIWDFFERLRQEAQENNNGPDGLGLTAGRRLYMFFSGHGFSPSLNSSGVLMANAERDVPHNLSPCAWADRFYENGLFEEVLLFQDACREPVGDVDLTPPYLKRAPAGGSQTRKRFYAFAAKSPLLAVEKPIQGVQRGVFAATLMSGLRDGAKDPVTGEIRASSLKRYLIDNMMGLLEPAELANEDIAREPEVHDLDPGLIIVPAANGPVVAAMFPVEVTLNAAARAGAEVRDSSRVVRSKAPADNGPWICSLPVSLYELLVPGQPSILFKVSGTVGLDGKPEVVRVP